MDFKPGDTVDILLRDSALIVAVECAGVSDRGLVRPDNEDHFLVARFGRFLKPMFTNLTGPDSEAATDGGYAMVVADGVGGSQSGEIASALAIRTFRKLVLDTCDWIISAGTSEAKRVMARMAERFPQMDAALIAKAEADPRLKGMATTLTLACSYGASLVLAHVGDSRAYLFRAGQLHQLTRDHTQAQALMDEGTILRLEDASAVFRRTLVRALGSSAGLCHADVDHLTLLDKDQVLLCTDGLTEMVDAAAIAVILRDAPDVAEACQRLVAAALKNGGRDNVTVTVARYSITPCK